MYDGGAGRRALVVDNWDSFTGNVCALIQKVTGVAPYLVPNTTSAQDLELLIQTHHPDFIVLSPGPGNPLNASDFGINQYVLQSVSLPVFGICLGMQGIAAYHGATIGRVPDPRHGFPRPVHHNGIHPLFKDVPSPFSAVCYNSLCASRVSNECDLIAWTEDGIAMAIDAKAVPQIGIQFHPESHLTDYGDLIIRNFLRHFVKTASGNWISTPKSTVPISNSHSAQPLWLNYRFLHFPAEFSAESLFMRLKSGASTNSDCIWLDSADGGHFSYISVNSQHRISFNGEKRHVVDNGSRGRSLSETESFFDYLQSRLCCFSLTDDAKRACAELPFDFVGGYVGYLSYEMKSECGERDPNSNGWCRDYPAAAFALVDRMVVLDHKNRIAYIVLLSVNESPSESELSWLSETQSIIKCSAVAPNKKSSSDSRSVSSFVCRDSKESYEQKVSKCLSYIADGHSYELCLTTQHTSMGIVPDPLALYRDLRNRNPAPFSAFIQFDDVSICSCSPERFVRVDRDQQVSSQPIKGTIRRGRSDSDDRRLQAQLESSSKDRAENLMITDLVRHDLSHCCVPGSVHVERFCELQKFKHVFQLTSTITGQLSSDHDAISCVKAAFPPGSMTGAPKRRSVQILEGIEASRRGIYSGCLGFLSFNGSADFSVVIRTIICTPSSTSIGSGGAVVSLSDPESEYAEMLLKAEAPIQITTKHLVQ